MDYDIKPNDYVTVQGKESLGIGEVLRVSESAGEYIADIAFDTPEGKKLETVPINHLAKALSLWERLENNQFDPPLNFYLKQLSYQFPLQNLGGELSNSRTELLPHQILLTHQISQSTWRKFLVADEVGLGKTIEIGMIIKELFSRNEAKRILIVCPAGLTKNWQNELRGCFKLNFQILGRDFIDTDVFSWETNNQVIASIDTLKQTKRMELIKQAPRWDLVVFDEAHHLSRKRYGKKIDITQNYKLAEVLRGYTRDLLFLSATPHQGDPFQFWSLIQLLDDQLFESPEAIGEHRGLLGRVMFRRIKREVTDYDGNPIFMRRQVHTQEFSLAARERVFYEKLTEYLKEGYSAAGIGQEKTTSKQRAIGFVMVIFQKIMSSSPRAIKQALRRRLLSLLARQQMELEAKMAGKGRNEELASRIVNIQEEMRKVTVDILFLPHSPTQRAEADTYIAQLKQRLAKKYAAEEMTGWALDEGETEEEMESIYADASIPFEIDKVRELIHNAPDGADRKFDTLIRAIEQIRREFPQEKFVIFTQYVETQEFLKEELGKSYGEKNISIIRGGPLDDKIAAMEDFWKDGGTQFLISTTAGGEGINLQVCHILFNYDLPWNPMAVEQRIGRIHRYGQENTVQIYNLVAEDTVEERIYFILEQKLLEIAQAIGKTDPATGEVVEDFRSEILGFLGSSPNYQELYKKALIDKDYKRTEQEIAEAIEKAKQASEVLRELTQQLESFNLENYNKIKGYFTLLDLKTFLEKVILKFGGTMLSKGDFYRIQVPEVFQKFPSVAPIYESVTFDRKKAVRLKKAELLGLGHPLIDAIITYLQSPKFPAEVSIDKIEPLFSARYFIKVNTQSGISKHFYLKLELFPENNVRVNGSSNDISLLLSTATPIPTQNVKIAVKEAKDLLEGYLKEYEIKIKNNTDGVLSIQSKLVGLVVKES
ncbi:MAG: DEAD/DEAH box helicase family protein [Candidatus Omnitrophica bacterium]|nr:DEAD/DEAH box helicase family protein [Candidatus Omnitrophota bacterium]